MEKKSGFLSRDPGGGYVVGENLNNFRLEDLSVPRNFEVRQICSDGSLMTLHSFSVPMDLRVQFGPFSSISNGEFVFWGGLGGVTHAHPQGISLARVQEWKKSVDWQGLISTQVYICGGQMKSVTILAQAYSHVSTAAWRPSLPCPAH